MKKLLLAVIFAFSFAISYSQTLTEQQIYQAAISKNGNVTGATAQSVLNNNIALATAGATSVNVVSDFTVTMRSFSVQIVGSAGISAGAIIFEGSNDNTTFTAIPVYETPVFTSASLTTAAVTIAASTNRYFYGNTPFTFFRIRISTAFVGGTVQALISYSPYIFIAPIQVVTQATLGNLNAVIGSSSSSVLSVGIIPAVVADVASAAITTTTTTATITPTTGFSYQVNIPVTVVTGTTPTLDVDVQESDDTGTNWFTVYSFARITATGFYRSPKLPFTGNRVRYVQTLTGTSPSFTRAINRLQSSDVAPIYRQLIDRSVVLTTLNSNTPSLTVGGAKNVTVEINIGSATTAPAIQIEGSGDGGLTWYALGTPLTSVASSTVSLTVANVSPQLVRARISTAGVTVVAGYVLLRCF
jgi:hypothetical protein